MVNVEDYGYLFAYLNDDEYNSLLAPNCIVGQGIVKLAPTKVIHRINLGLVRRPAATSTFVLWVQRKYWPSVRSDA